MYILRWLRFDREKRMMNENITKLLKKNLIKKLKMKRNIWKHLNKVLKNIMSLH